MMRGTYGGTVGDVAPVAVGSVVSGPVGDDDD